MCTPYFVDTKYGDGKTIWESNPLNTHRLRAELCERTSKPVLQAFCRAVYSYADSLKSDVGSGGPVTPMQAGKVSALKLTKSLVVHQVDTMRVLQRLLIAIEVACMTATEDDGSGVGSSKSRPTIGSDLVLTGVSRLYNYMLPLIKLKSKGPFLLRACATCRHALSVVPKTQWYPACQQIHARVTYEMRRIARELGEDGILTLTSKQHAEYTFDKPVVEQIALRESMNCSPTIWRDGKAVSSSLAMVPIVDDDLEIESVVWDAVHGSIEDEEVAETADESDKRKKERIMEAFGKLREEHEKHDRYLEFVCRLSKVAIDIGLADFVDDWLMNNFDLDSPTPTSNTEEMILQLLR